MGEIDSKPIESVQAALSFFGEKNDQRKFRSASSVGKLELEEKELNLMSKDLSNYKVQLEVKESAYKQALLKLELYQNTVEKLSTQLKTSEADRDGYNEECKEAKTRIDVLESKINEISDRLLESGKAQEELLHALNELTATKEELFNTRAELASAKESKLAAMTQVELLEMAAKMEKEKTEELLKHISELNEAILLSKLGAIEAEKEKTSILLEKETEIQMATTALVQAQEQLEDMKKEVDIMHDLENQILAKTLFIDLLQLELKQAKEFNTSSVKTTSDAINDINELKSELELVEREKSNREIFVESMEMELKELHLELKKGKEEVDHLNGKVEMLSSKIQKAESEMDELRGRESDAQVELAMLNSELHKARSKIAAAEADEVRVQRVKSGLYLAVKHLAIEAQEAKMETQRLKQEAEKEKAKVMGNTTLVDPQFVDLTRDEEPACVEEPKIEIEERRDDADFQITISIKDYESLIRKAETSDRVTVLPFELDALKKELEAALEETRELRSVAEEAVSRAELAEKAKAAIEDQLRKWREHKQKRRAAMAALREESVSKESNRSKYDNPHATYQPLGKVLNMKF